jgi:hypothetical protein
VVGTQRPRRLAPRLSPEAARAQRKFLRYFPEGYADETFHDWERDYKARAAQRWQEMLGAHELTTLIRGGKYRTVAARAVAIESRTNLLFSFEKMALRDAVRTPAAARSFALGLLELTNESANPDTFQRWCDVMAKLPRRQTRVFSWPIVTVFGFLARPDLHIFLKPNVTRRAAGAYGFDFYYETLPNWRTYQSLLEFAAVVRRDTRSLRPRDMIDLQSFIWVQGSDEYP